MKLVYIKLGIILALAPAITMVRLKLLYHKGINCNMESFQSVTHRIVNRYFCVPKSGCRPSPHRIPVIPYDLCNDYYYGVNGESLMCCHQSDFRDKPDKEWLDSYNFLPSFRSYIMCRHYSHLLCADDGTSYCDKSKKELITTINTKGIPQLIEKFPHTALIGYSVDSSNTTFRWFCMGSIVSERVIITASNCESETFKGEYQLSTHVKVGESIICENCPDQPEEQIIHIKRWELDLKEKNDIFFIYLSKDIKFSNKVRPACLLRQPYSPTRGWYVHYGKPETYVTTAKTYWPVFHYPDNPTFITFKVRTSQHAVIHLSSTGGPNKRDPYFEVRLGEVEGGAMRSSLVKGLMSSYSKTPNILDEFEFRGFWIRIDPEGGIWVGEEDKTTAFLALEDVDNTFNVSVVGLSTPDSTGEWLFADHETLFSLNGREVDVLYENNCTEYHPNFETVEKYVSRTDDKYYIGEAELCAGDLHNGVAPCDNDWGSTIQIMDKDLYCMWQMFGLYSEDKSRNCSVVNSPAVFVNFANHLAYIEENAYPWFPYDWMKLKVDRPVCLLPSSNLTDPGRCPAVILPK